MERVAPTGPKTKVAKERRSVFSFCQGPSVVVGRGTQTSCSCGKAEPGCWWRDRPWGQEKGRSSSSVGAFFSWDGEETSPTELGSAHSLSDRH